MAGNEAILINDDLFQKTLSCPLKFVHIIENQEERRPSGLQFRQRNKLHVRDAIAYQFRNCRHTSNSTQSAFKETKEWLKEKAVVICGAVVCHENLLTRIPILVKDGQKLTIIQVHGKLRKRSEGDEIRSFNRSRSITRYLLKAAYRLEVVQRSFPGYDVQVDFYFPNKHFKSSSDHLHLFFDDKIKDDQEIRNEFSELFSKVKATDAVREVHQKIPESVSHKRFKHLSIEKAIQNIIQNDFEDYGVNRHSGCKYCAYRLPELKDETGCWDRFFSSEDILHPEKHVFELIGHGNSIESENGTFYQEEAEFSRGFKSFEDARDYSGPNITILQRRNIQILQSRDETVPLLWIKPGIKSIETLRYPLHFIDFEAATYALPMKSGWRPYNPVFFQFSCHTLYENGELIHTEWLDQQAGEIHPHEEFVNRLGTIPDIFQGTIMQYSPFEKQGINRLIGDFSRDAVEYEVQIDILEKIRKSEFPGYENRFFDVSKIIRDYYFNMFLNDSLGLKQVLSGILRWEQTFGELLFPIIEIDESAIDINRSIMNDEIPDPYKDIQNPDFLISDGSAAMNAWLAFKNGLLTDEETFQIPRILRKYCALDSYALYIIYEHLRNFTPTIEDKDLIKF